MKTRIISFIILGLSSILVMAAAGFAQGNPSYIQFSPGAVKGALYKPDSGTAPHVAILVAHRTSNFMGTLACAELSKRGFMVLCMNPRFDNNEALVRWEDIALDMKSGMDFLRKQPGITKVLLWGHSGGGPTMSFYEAVAENGPSYCQGQKKLVECGNNLSGLTRADGLILVDAHPGNTVNALRSLNPAVTNDAGILNQNQHAELNPDLDPFNPKNGYNPNGSSSYPESFKKKYFFAQSQRMNRLIDLALAKVKEMNKGDSRFPDDDAFLVVRGDGARLMQLDLTIDHDTTRPQKFLKNDGTIVKQIAESVRLADPTLAKQNATFDAGARFLTARSFLSANAIRSTDSMTGIDWCSSNNSTPCALQSISIPLLITAMGAHYFIRDSEILYEVARSKDKDFIVIEGATHGQTPCVPCEKSPGQYSNTVKNLYDYVRDWINTRF